MVAVLVGHHGGLWMLQRAGLVLSVCKLAKIAGQRKCHRRQGMAPRPVGRRPDDFGLSGAYGLQHGHNGDLGCLVAGRRHFQWKRHSTTGAPTHRRSPNTNRGRRTEWRSAIGLGGMALFDWLESATRPAAAQFPNLFVTSTSERVEPHADLANCSQEKCSWPPASQF